MHISQKRSLVKLYGSKKRKLYRTRNNGSRSPKGGPRSLAKQGRVRDVCGCAHRRNGCSSSEHSVVFHRFRSCFRALFAVEDCEVQVLVAHLQRFAFLASLQTANCRIHFLPRLPLFVQIGEVVKVDTRTGEYVSRAGK